MVTRPGSDPAVNEFAFDLLPFFYVEDGQSTYIKKHESANISLPVGETRSPPSSPCSLKSWRLSATGLAAAASGACNGAGGTAGGPASGHDAINADAKNAGRGTRVRGRRDVSPRGGLGGLPLANGGLAGFSPAKPRHRFAKCLRFPSTRKRDLGGTVGGRLSPLDQGRMEKVFTDQGVG